MDRQMDVSLVEDVADGRAFAEVPRTMADRVVLKVGGERLDLNRWGTVLVSALVGGSPMLSKAVRVIRPRRMKRPRIPSAGESTMASAPVSTARVAAPLGEEASVAGRKTTKPDRATRRARRRVRRYASGDIGVATDDEAARRFLTQALATSDPVTATYKDREVTFTADGSRAVLGLFSSSRLRLALVHLLLGADAYRPHRDGPAEPADPADPWGPFPGDALSPM